MDMAWSPWTMMDASYGKSLANFGAAYAAKQESITPRNIYTPPQQQRTFNNLHDRRNGRGHSYGGTGGGNGGGSFPQQPAWFGGSIAGAQQSTHPPTPYKRWENWNYCSAHVGDIEGGQHTTQMRPAPT